MVGGSGMLLVFRNWLLLRMIYHTVYSYLCGVDTSLDVKFLILYW